MRSSVRSVLLSSALLLPLAACATAGRAPANYNGYSPTATHTSSSSAPDEETTSSQSLPSLERAYKRDGTNQTVALKYATALQDAGRSNRAVLVLTPFIDSGEANHNAPLLTEYASIQASLGNYDVAASTAQKAVAADPQNGTAYHVLGIALDAQGNHPDAEEAFRRALAHWQGNPAPVLNNLGLNLAAQGFIDESVDTLKKAVALAPDRPEIERNLRIVVALQKQPGTHENKRVPPPARKPGADSVGKNSVTTNDTDSDGNETPSPDDDR